MWPKGWPGAALTVLLLTVGVRGDTVLYTATVIVPEAVVRSGAGDKAPLYPTNRLRQGDTVEVTREMGEWLAIRPPRGSFSWANTRHVYPVHPDQTLWTVHTRSAVLMGSTIHADKPTVEGARVERGTILRSIGPPRQAEDGYWLPVEPPPSEVRYLLAASVSRSKPGAVPPAAPPPGLPSPLASPPGPVATPTAVVNPGVDPRWQRAQQAEQAGHYPEAIHLYNQLGQEVANSNHSLAVQAFSRANWLSERTRSVRPSQKTDVLYPTPGAPPATPAPTPLPTSAGPPGLVGTLRPLSHAIDAQRAYVLWDSQGRPLVHVVAGPGVNLDQHVNQVVEVAGPRVARADLRAELLTATSVRPR